MGETQNSHCSSRKQEIRKVKTKAKARRTRVVSANQSTVANCWPQNLNYNGVSARKQAGRQGGQGRQADSELHLPKVAA